ncbi:MAG: FAD-linked oxidase C-terminal domain-containing protein [Candidatus Zixiibacteriota bacterium]
MSTHLENLRALLLSPKSLILDLSAHENYSHDATEYVSVAAGLLLAESIEDIVTAINFCRDYQIAIVPRGAGTGLSGGCVASSSSLLISTERFVQLDIDTTRQLAIVGPGVFTKVLQDASLAKGLCYPPDPASYTEASIGGNVAEGAGGLRCKRFGVTKDYVIGLEAVTINGEILRTGIFSDNSGFCIGDILIASEGTLAIITRIAVRLIPAIEGSGATILVAFSQPRDAAQTVADITTSGIIPNILEFLDGDAAACSNQYEATEGLDKAAAILLLETTETGVAGQVEAIRTICQTNHCSYLRIESDPAKAEALWKVRRNLSKAIKSVAAYRVSEDVAVPNTKFPDLVGWVARENAASSLRINAFGHAGDGNLHVYFVSSTGSDSDKRLIEEGVDRLMKETIRLGGTLTGEHGVGLAKKKYLPLEFSPATIGVMRGIKTVFDSEYLLNPGKLLP